METVFTVGVPENTTHNTGSRRGKESTMDFITVDITDTVGQASAIEANGSPVFTIRVTAPASIHSYAKDGSANEICGFGRVVGGPVNGHEILYRVSSVVEPVAPVQHRDGLVVFA